jgi:cell wall-associated NlpC family hydrolase
MRRTTTVAVITSTITSALLAAGFLVGAPAASADEPPASPPTWSRGSIHEEASRQAAADYRRKARQQRDALQRGDAIRALVIERALAQVGDDYDAGAEGPDAFDCSGLVVYAWRAAGVELEHYSRAQYQATQRISLDEARPGDLAFYFENGAHHVAIYIGDGKVVHASDYGIGVVKGVVKGTPWTNEHFTGMGRVKIPR